MTPATTPIGEVWMILKDRRRLGRLMAFEGISQRRLATMVGLKSHTYLGKLVRGEVKTIDPDHALKICLALHVNVDDLFMPNASNIPARTGREKRPAA